MRLFVFYDGLKIRQLDESMVQSGELTFPVLVLQHLDIGEKQYLCILCSLGREIEETIPNFRNQKRTQSNRAKLQLDQSYASSTRSSAPKQQLIGAVALLFEMTSVRIKNLDLGFRRGGAGISLSGFSLGLACIPSIS